VSPQPPDDACLVQIVGGHFHFDAVAGGEPDPAFAHFSADSGQHDVVIVELNSEHRSGQNRMHDTFDFDMFFFHNVFLVLAGPVVERTSPTSRRERRQIEARRDAITPRTRNKRERAETTGVVP